MNRGVSAGDCPKSQRERGLPVRRVFSILEVGGQDARAPSEKRVSPHFLDSLAGSTIHKRGGIIPSSHDDSAPSITHHGLGSERSRYSFAQLQFSGWILESRLLWSSLGTAQLDCQAYPGLLFCTPTHPHHRLLLSGDQRHHPLCCFIAVAGRFIGEQLWNFLGKCAGFSISLASVHSLPCKEA